MIDNLPPGAELVSDPTKPNPSQGAPGPVSSQSPPPQYSNLPPGAELVGTDPSKPTISSALPPRPQPVSPARPQESDLPGEKWAKPALDLATGFTQQFMKGAIGVNNRLNSVDDKIHSLVRNSLTKEHQDWLEQHHLGAAIKPIPQETEQDWGFPKGSLDSQNFGEWLGQAGENILEFERANSVLGANAKFKKLAETAEFLKKNKVIADIANFGLTTLRQAGISAGQRFEQTGDMDKAWDDFKKTGTVSAVLGILGAAGSVGTATVRNFLTKGPELEEAEATAKGAGKAILAEGRTLAEKLGHEPGGTQPELTENVKASIKDAINETQSNFDQQMSKTLQDAKGVPFVWDGSPVQKKALALQGDSKIPPEIKEELDKLQPGKKEAIDGILKRFGIGSAKEPAKGGMKAQYTWDEMEATRRNIGEQIRELPDDNYAVKHILSELRDGIDDTFTQSATNAGKPELATSLDKIRDDYFQKVTLWQTKAITRLAKAHPDSIADILMSGEKIENVKNLGSLIGGENMKPVRGGLFNKLFADSKNADESLNPSKLFNKWANMSDGVKEQLFGPELPEVQEFFNKSIKNIEQTQQAVTDAQYAQEARGIAGRAILSLPTVAPAAYGVHLLWKSATGSGSDAEKSMERQEGLGYLAVSLGGATSININPRWLANPVIRNLIVKAMDAAGKPQVQQIGADLANAVEKASASDSRQTYDHPEDLDFVRAHRAFEGDQGVTQ
jgi:hypothetical protein